MTPEQELTRAGSAERILNDPLIKEAFTDIEKDVIDRLAICDVRDSISREKLCLLLSSLRLFKSVFEGYIETGKMAAITLERKNSLILGGRKVF